MPALSLTVDGVERSVEQGTTGADLFGDRADVVVARVNGEITASNPSPFALTI